ncbi:hypothetical protein B0J11DRAFT_620339 [Dendryphion nanum]|uniref:Mid2 domain-containing protein n=1 Tax=Dendryphion nanum TaxID=256645 RepID=A0A9P9CZF3_9PLEO|nr:hypothetical protein B0J11DRAFT_620339 [Dendryphion nanum]
MTTSTPSSTTTNPTPSFIMTTRMPSFTMTAPIPSSTTRSTTTSPNYNLGTLTTFTPTSFCTQSDRTGQETITGYSQILIIYAASITEYEDFCCPQVSEYGWSEEACHRRSCTNLLDSLACVGTRFHIIDYTLDVTSQSIRSTPASLSFEYVYAYGFAVRYQSTDIISVTSTAQTGPRAATATNSLSTNSSQNPSGGLSKTTKIGIGVGVPIAVILLAIGFIVIIIKRRRKGAVNSSRPLPESPDNMESVGNNTAQWDIPEYLGRSPGNSDGPTNPVGPWRGDLRPQSMAER